MRRHIVRVGQVAVLFTVLVSATASVHAADPSSPGASGSPVVPTSSSMPGQPSAPHDAPWLEALLPAEVDGVPLFRTSLGPTTWVGFGADSPGAIRDIADGFGVDVDAITMAAANDPTADSIYNVFVIAVAGLPGATVSATYARLAQEAEVGSTLDPATVGGIAVTHLSAPSNQIPNVWFWAVDDVMFGIQAADAETASRLIALLPTSVPTPVPAASPNATP